MSASTVNPIEAYPAIAIQSGRSVMPKTMMDRTPIFVDLDQMGEMANGTEHVGWRDKS
jgi:hypothetical protein